MLNPTCLRDYLKFKNGKTSPKRSDQGAIPVYGSNGQIGRADESNASGALIVIGRVGSYCGSLYYSSSDAWVTDNAIVCTSSAQSDIRYWYYALQTLDLNSRSSGSGQPLLNQSILGAIPFQAPDVEERRAIAEVLGALDDKIAANTKLAETTMELAGEIYRHGVVAFPDIAMNEVLSPILGGTPARGRPVFWGGEALWASAKDVTGAEMGVITDTEEKITEQASSSTKAKPLPEGSVILTARGTVGAVARLATPAAFNQSCYGFVPGALPPALLYFGVLSAANRAKKIAHGSVFDTITMKTFAHLPLPDMPETEIEKLESRLAPQLRVTTEAVRENRTLAATRDALLPQLMSGKLRVKDIENTMGEMV